MECDTRQQILNAAEELFSQKGFNGTPVRDIAQLADVNVAAINYHFRNKRELLHEVLKTGYIHLSKEVSRIAKKNTDSFVELTGAIFNVLLKNDKIVLNCMKIILDEGFDDFDDIGVDDEMIGPPGGMILFDMITKEVGTDIDEASRKWAVVSIFSIMFHKALVIKSPYGKRPTVKKVMNKNKSLEDITRLAQLILNDLKSK
jgi:hypothetical protein